MCTEFSSPSITNLIGALLRFQQSLKPIFKDAKNPFLKSSYCSLSNVLEVIRPLLLEQNIVLIQRTVPAEAGSVAIETRLYHVSGEWISELTVIPLPIHPDGKVNIGQLVGGAISYGRRYGLMAICALSAFSEDTDLNMEFVPNQQLTPKQKQSPVQSPTQSQDAQDLPQLEGISYRRIQDASGQVKVIAEGNTMPFRDKLKGSGFSWNQSQRAWMRPAV